MSREQVGYAMICYDAGLSAQWIADRIGFSRTAVDHQLKVQGITKRSVRRAMLTRRAGRMDYLPGMNLERNRDLPTATNPITGR